MTVLELRELLTELISGGHANDIVVLARDAEGNGYCKLADYGTFDYADGDIGFSKLTDALIEQGYTEDDVIELAVPALVLWPV